MGRQIQCDDIYYYIIRQVIPVGLTPVATTMDTGTEDSEKIKSVSGRARSNLYRRIHDKIVEENHVYYCQQRYSIKSCLLQSAV
jgi:hypothetical protein